MEQAPRLRRVVKECRRIDSESPVARCSESVPRRLAWAPNGETRPVAGSERTRSTGTTLRRLEEVGTMAKRGALPGGHLRLRSGAGFQVTGEKNLENR